MSDSTPTDVLERLAMGVIAVTARSIATVDADLTFNQWRVLVIVGERGRGIAMSELAERTGSALSPASRVVKRMERRGWVRLTKAVDDRRVTLVHPTDAGTAVRDAVFTRRRTYLADVVSAIAPVGTDEVDVIDRIARAFAPFV
jgi:DNA-binding MarR family transcriptional regulator